MKQICATILFFSLFAGCKKSTPEDEYYNLTVLVLDYDARTPIANAKVFPANGLAGKVDSAFSDGNGKAFFRFKKDGSLKAKGAFKDNYLSPSIFYLLHTGFEDRTDTTYLAKPSYVNLTIHKTGAYLPLDSIALRVNNDYASPNTYLGMYRNLAREKADAPDKVYNLYSWYQSGNITKLYFEWDIIRAGSVISTKTDSTGLIQFGTKNFTLNY
jgi:hypothetical protein